MQERVPGGHWIGQLATSALSTATAISALTLVQRHAGPDGRFGTPITAGLRYLLDHQNADGGWGDTDRSHSNIATTMLARAAIHLTGTVTTYAAAEQQAADYIRRQGELAGLRARYGKDRTFAVPILTNLRFGGPRLLGVRSRIALRAGLSPATVLSLGASARRQLCDPGPGGDRTGASFPPGLESSSDALDAASGGRAQPAGAAADAARQRRLSGGHAADQLCGHEPGGDGACRPSGGAGWRAFPAGFDSPRRQLADRHEPGDVDHHAGHQRVGGSRRRCRAIGVSAVAAGLPASPAASFHRRRPGRMGLVRSERGGPRCR